MAGGKTIGTKVARGGQQIGELHRLIAAHTGDRGLAAHVAVGKILHHLVVEAAFVIENIMRDAKAAGDSTRIMNVCPGAASTLGLNRDAVVIELQRDADNVEPLLMKQRRCHRTVDAA